MTGRTTDRAPIRWGVAGPGTIAKQFGNAVAQTDGCEIVAVASRSIERAHAYTSEFGVARTHASYEALAADPDVDIVYVATTAAQHMDTALLFLESGKPVLCEKPFALNVDQATRMISAARARGLFLMEALWSRFLPSYRRLVELIADGAIGTPMLVEADFGFRLGDPTHRLFDPHAGGGALLDLGIYPVQLAQQLLGPPDHVAAVAHIGATGVDESIAAVLHHDGGALAVVKAAINTAMTCTARVAGTDGVIDIPAFMHCPNRLVLRRGTSKEQLDLPIEGEGLRYQLEEVHECLRTGSTQAPTMPWSETLALAATLDEIRRAVGLTYPAEFD